MRIMEPFRDQNYCVYLDRYYTSVNLLQYMIQNRATKVVGTTMTNRKEFPAELKKT